MSQKELQILIAKNRLLSWEQKYVLLEKISSFTEEQVAKLIAHFNESNDKLKSVLISKIKESDLRRDALKVVFHKVKKMALREKGDVVSEDESSSADAYLKNELNQMKQKPKAKVGFFQKIANFFKFN